jgi:hypothetical protein
VEPIASPGVGWHTKPVNLGQTWAKTAILSESNFKIFTGSDYLDAIAMHLAMLDLPFTPLEPPELRERCAELSRRLREAAAGGESAAAVRDN